MSELRWVRIESTDAGVRVVSLDRPPVNALGRELVADIRHVCRRLEDDADARCVVFRSAGRHFCAGADLKERQGMAVDDVRAVVRELGRAMDDVAALPMPTVAAVRGAAAGGGCELALACDLRIVAEDASLGLRETALAIIPGAGGTQRLPRLIGPARAKRWIFSAAMHTADQAMSDGVADRVVPADHLDREAAELAGTIAANGPVAVRLAKRAIDGGLHLPSDRAMELEWECYTGVLETRDRLEALKAFAEKRPPRFEGR